MHSPKHVDFSVSVYFAHRAGAPRQEFLHWQVSITTVSANMTRIYDIKTRIYNSVTAFSNLLKTHLAERSAHMQTRSLTFFCYSADKNATLSTIYDMRFGLRCFCIACRQFDSFPVYPALTTGADKNSNEWVRLCNPLVPNKRTFRAAVIVLVGPCCRTFLNCIDIDVHTLY